MRDYRLYLVADPVFMKHRSVEEVVTEAANANVSMIQLREKSCSNEEFLGLARRFARVLREYSIPLIINDRVDIARLVGAQGVHVGQSDVSWREARRILGPDAIVGVSVEHFGHLQGLEHLYPAGRSGVDYLGVSGVFASATKPELKAPWGLYGLKALRAATQLPLVGIGGITETNVESVIRAGADGIAVVSAITQAPNPGAAAARLKTIVDSALHTRAEALRTHTETLAADNNQGLLDPHRRAHDK